MTIETIYFVHHSHTDIGYTHDQPVVWEMERRFIDAAIDTCEQYLDQDTDHAFRWTVETVGPLLYWLDHSTSGQIERFLRLERRRRIEVTGMFVHITPLADTAELVEMFQPLKRLRSDYGLTVRYAMDCDVNGMNWGLTDILLDAGIEGFTMGINEHAGGAPLNRPNVFWWQAPSGRRILALNGWHYHMGNHLKIGTHFASIDSLRSEGIPFVQRKLEEVGWPLPFVMIQGTHGFGDNGSADSRLSDFVREWNAGGNTPRIRISTPSEWWAAVQPYAERLAVYRGDWTDFWNFGAISSAREAAINRNSRSRLLAADELFGLSSPLGIRPDPANDPLLATTPALRDEAWRSLYLWDEHTWGADISISQPESDDTASQWNHKAHYAYEARSLSLMLQRDSVGELSRLIPREPDDALILVNPLPWARTMTGPVSQDIMQPRGTGDDPSSSRHHQDRERNRQRWWLKSGERVEVPPTGYTVVRREQLIEDMTQTYSETPLVENEFHRLTFDLSRGGLASWFDKRLQRELVDHTAGWNFGGTVYERVADLDHPRPRRLLYVEVGVETGRHGWQKTWRADRWGASRLLSHKVYQLPSGIEIVQRVEVKGLASPATYRIFVPDAAPTVEFNAEWQMTDSTHPEATYLALPFDVPAPTAHFDLGGQAIQPDVDQIPRSCRDYFTVQRWVDLSAADWGVTVACPDNPMVQLGDFHYGQDQQHITLERALFLGWITNNYWETNFRPNQPGRVTARYVVLPHQGGYDESAAHRFGLEAAAPIILQSAFEPARKEANLPRAASLLTLPQPPILVLHVLPAWAQRDTAQNAVFVRLLNASGETRTATIGSNLLTIRAAQVCDLFGAPGDNVAVSAGTVSLELAPRRLAVLRLTVDR